MYQRLTQDLWTVSVWDGDRWAVVLTSPLHEPARQERWRRRDAGEIVKMIRRRVRIADPAKH